MKKSKITMRTSKLSLSFLVGMVIVACSSPSGQNTGFGSGSGSKTTSVGDGGSDGHSTFTPGATFSGKIVNIQGVETYETLWKCRLGERFVLNFEKSVQEKKRLFVNFSGKKYTLVREPSLSGTPVYFDAKSGIRIIMSRDSNGIKAMMVNQNKGMLIASDCYSSELTLDIL